MTITQAEKRRFRLRVLSLTLMVGAVLFLLAGAQKSLYVLLQQAEGPFSRLAYSIQALIDTVYENTQFFSIIWEAAPVATFPQELNSSGNWGFVFILAILFLGRVMWDSASVLGQRIKRTRERVQELRWEREMDGKAPVPSSDDTNLIQVTVDLENKERWYKRPSGIVLLGIVVAVAGQWLNLRFGFA